MIDDLLSPVLAEPSCMLTLSLAQWERIIRQARCAQLLARLAECCAERGWLDAVPPRPRVHLQTARRVGEQQRRNIHYEVHCLRRALAGIGTPIILLKGAAYVMARLPPAIGRLFGDIDIMVARERLHDVERALFAKGWITQKLDAYDQRYYRRWMHELPPLQHVRRGAVLDVHHTITPPTSRLRIDARALLAAARPLDGHNDLFVLQPIDMVLHSATHLFQDGEFEHGLRDLVDIDDLLRHWGRDAAFWPALAARAAELGLGRPLYYAALQIRRLFATTMPASFLAEIRRFAPRHPARGAMATLLPIALRPPHPSCDGPLTGFARWALYVRAHYLRMPAHLLVPHLLRKAYMRKAGNNG